MSDITDAAMPSPDMPYVPPSAGAELRAVREASGLTIEDVAQQLKLAPRQVRALEDDDYAKLPGRTFVRGFVRNYARFLQLDPDEVLALLPGSDVAPALERPTLTASGRPMGELPADTPARRSAARWAIPLVLVAIVVAAAMYEVRRQQSEHDASVEATARAPAPSTATGASAPPTALPNPLTAPASAEPGALTASASDTTAAESGNAAAPQPAAAPASTEAVATSTPAAATPESPAPTTTQAPAPELVFTFKGKSWVQVKDASGSTLLAVNGQPGSTQSVSGAPPLDVVIGNVRDVTATFRGQPVDLAPYARGDVARLSLK
ncbi:MAG TPA: RodZ domain-containing protein [Casimicrobiaceae bacterium]